MNWIPFLTLLTQILLFVAIVSLIFRTHPAVLGLRVMDQLWRNISGRPIYGLSQVNSQLFVGGQHYRRGWDNMQRHGISAVVNMREAQHNDQDKNIAPESYLHLPTKDGTSPTVEQLCQGIGFIHEHIQGGGKVYIHCASGFHRAPTMAAAYLMTTGLSLEDALAAIRSVRPFAKPIKSQIEVLKRLLSEAC